MNTLALWLANLLSRLLEPRERDALHGDHAELNVSGAKALRDVFGLVIRRQLEPWKNWRPWLAVVSGVLPFLIYGVVNIQVAHGFSKISPMRFLTGEGSSYSGWIFIGSLLLLGGLGAWACAFVVSSFSQRARGVNLGLISLVWLLAFAGFTSPLYQKTWDGRPMRLFLAIAFHLVWFMAPAWAGLRRGRKSPYLSFSGIVVLAGLLCLPTALTLLAVATLDRGRGEIGLNEILFLALLSAVYAWPSVPIILRSLFSRRLLAPPLYSPYKCPIRPL